MRISKLLFVLCLTVLLSCKKTESLEYYVIKGQIENYNGSIYLTKAVDSKYYFNNFTKDSATVKDGKFEYRLSKNIVTPLPFYIETDETRTYHFLLEPKNQQIIIDSLYYNVSPKIICENSTIPNEELILEERKSLALNEFKTEFKKIENADFPKDSIEKLAINARENFTLKSNLVLTNFTKDYPNSYVSFWQIVTNQMYNGYNKELENAYNNLSTSIKKTKAAKLFEKSMLETKILSLGSNFPTLKLKNKELKEFELNPNENSKVTYTLVDFWFSYCGPCIAQFPKLKELQTKYHPNQLIIVSISTDKTKNIDNWYKIMEQKNIPWLNLLDENGNKTSALGVNSFPTNYLLDKDGIIIKKNISLIELEELLEKFQ